MIHNQESHKGRVTTLQAQFAEQKMESKKLFSDKINVIKTAIV